MKAISVRQPWAYLILQRGKNVENRTWSTDYRGPLLIHAGRQWASHVPGSSRQRDVVSAVRVGGKLIEWPDNLARGGGKLIEWPDNLARGAIVGMVELLGCVPANLGMAGDRQLQKLVDQVKRSAWAEAGMVHWLLSAPRAFAEPILYRGKQGIFEVPDELVRGARSAELEAEVDGGGHDCE